MAEIIIVVNMFIPLRTVPFKKISLLSKKNIQLSTIMNKKREALL